MWIFGLFVVPDAEGKDKLVGHYSRRKGLGGEYEQGIAVWNDEKAIFEPAKQLPLKETWRRPSGHPILHEFDGRRWLLFGSPSPNVRVPATLADVLHAGKYEAFTCVAVSGDLRQAPAAAGDTRRAMALGEPLLDKDGRPIWRWQKELPPVNSQTESKWLAAGKIKAEDVRFYPADAAAPAQRVILHSGSVRWNPHRQRWVLVAGQTFGKPSFLGEVWYAEAREPTGPFTKAVRVVTHDKQTFYNVCHHAFLDRDGGRFIHFEGTYTNEFSGNPEKTARYNYNQVLYRLDLDAEGLKGARVE